MKREALKAAYEAAKNGVGEDEILRVAQKAIRTFFLNYNPEHNYSKNGIDKKKSEVRSEMLMKDNQGITSEFLINDYPE